MSKTKECNSCVFKFKKKYSLSMIVGLILQWGIKELMLFGNGTFLGALVGLVGWGLAGIMITMFSRLLEINKEKWV